MKICHASILVVLSLFAAHSTRAADWEIVASANAGRQANSLSSVAAVADNDVWAAGWAFNAQLNAYRTVTEHWNGTPWNIVSSPNVPGFSNILQAISVASANDIWAVGYSQDTNFNTFTLTLHWNGTTWSIVPSPTVDHDILFGVDAIATNDVWAAGRSRPGGYGEDRTLTMHWNGANWTVVPSPNGGVNDNDLFGVAMVASNDVWAAGNNGSLATLAIPWDGPS